MTTKKKRISLLFLSVLFVFAIFFCGISVKSTTVKADEQIYPTEMTKTEFFFARLSGFYNDFKNSVSNKNMSVSETLYGVNLSVTKGTGSYYPSWTAGSGCYFTIKNGNQVTVSAINGNRVYGLLLYGTYSINAGTSETSWQVGAPKFTITANTGEVTNNGKMIGWTGSANEVTFTFTSTNTAVLSNNFQMEKLYMWSSSEVIEAPSNPTFTADVSALANGFNTENAKTVYFGSGTTTTNTEVAPLKWKVVGYNGQGVSSKPGTMTLLADDILLSDYYMSDDFNYASLNHYNTISSDYRENHAYGVSKINNKLIEKASAFSSQEKNAIYEKSLFDSLKEAYNVPMWMPSENEVYLVHDSIKSTNAFATRTFKYTSNSPYVVTYTSNGWNKSRISKVQNLNVRPLLMIDLSQIESVTEGTDGIFTFNFVVPPHDHDWEYAVSENGEKLIATCGAQDCPTPTQELVINANDRDYDKSATHAFINTNNWQDQSLLSTIGLEVKYVGVNNTDYVETTTPPSNAGTYKAKVTIDNYTIEKQYTISPIDVDYPSGMNPDASPHDLFKNLNFESYEIQVWLGKTYDSFAEDMVYTGNPHQVVYTQTTKNGEDYGYSYYNVKGGYVVFSIGDMNGPWTKSPCVTEAGIHTLYWKIEASNGNYIGTEANASNFIYAVIEKVDGEITSAPTIKTNLVYNDTLLDLINAGNVNGGTLVYKIGANGSYSANIPQAKNAGTYEIYYKIQGDGNVNGTDESESNKLIVTIQKANRTSTPTLTQLSVGDIFVTFNQIEIDDGIVEYGYSLTENGEFIYSTNNQIINLEDDTNYYFRYKIINSNNYNDYVSNAILLKTIPSDTVAPQIIGADQNTRYCTAQTLTIIEDNLLFVKVDGVDLTNTLVDGKITLSVNAEPQTITVSDVAGNVCTIVVKILGHEASDWIIDTVPKIGIEGSKHIECIHCEETLETSTISPLVANAEQDESLANTDPVIEENAPQTQIKNNVSEIREKVLTTEDEQAIANGKKINVYIEVKDITESVSEETVSKVTEKVGENVTIVYLDLSLFKKIEDNDPTSVHELNGKIKISVVVPDNIKAEDRTYQIVRVHDGVAEIINGEYNQETGEFTFETDKFSTYALTYVDETLPSNNKLIPLLIIGGAVVIVVAVVIVFINKKRKKA